MSEISRELKKEPLLVVIPSNTVDIEVNKERLDTRLISASHADKGRQQTSFLQWLNANLGGQRNY